ncbi:outer membrane beta-barrel protein [Elizabethkingia miricola]|uniref:Outer membrane beta-barrel protein n=1 Tax=Elizabethkingia miricola TaxID=172045 RepID=A0ABD5B9J0_ELIMR|nr:outer membrane beta-barrel protein [Elizabethkingia miricola]MDQ8750400.1 outer membrane beta-barrel protein [Elizabethkingia miricola]
MKDKWLIDLKNKIEGHEENPPEGLWDSIENKIFPEYVNDYDKQKTKFRLNHIINAIGVAATVALLVSVIFFYEENEVFSHRVSKKYVINKSEKSDLSEPLLFDKLEKNISDVNYKTNQENNPHFIFNKVKYDSNDRIEASLKKQNTKQDNKIDNQINKLKDEIVNKSEDWVLTSVIKNKIDTSPYKSEFPSGREFVQLDNNDVKSKSIVDSKWSLNFTSRQTASNSSTQKGYTLMNGPLEALPYDGVETAESPISEILTENMNQEVNTNIKHRLPIRTGLSVSYQLNDKWSVTTGLIYTKLTSDLLSGTDANQIKSEQVIKYIGVPVQINYNIWQKGNLTTYVGAGIQIEKSISGIMNTDYIVHHQVKESTSSKIRINSLQTSMNIGLGVQYKVYKNFGVYFEPGMRYYFNDRSDVKTIYKDKPLNMNLEFGLRYFIH